ncbi:hypothetical protein TNCV_610161 [Trichonephila clavipes]|nr:hypothetical protein TNCV_610161 [Trichonephila clavipes]
MPKSSWQVIPDILDWRQIWGSGRPIKVVSVRGQPCDTLSMYPRALPCLKMASGSRCMSDYTCSCMMSGTYHWAAMVPRINTRVTVYCIQCPPYHHTRCGGGCCCEAKAGLKHSPLGLHTRTRLSSLLRLNMRH